MSCNYAENLSHYENKGKLGMPEIFDSEEVIEEKCMQLAELLRGSSHTVVHSGAGISTSAGIPDFRGPNGVWTLEKKGEKPSINVTWDDANPTKTHMALFALQKAGYVSYVITQNIDGLHLRSGFPRRCLAELHGNLYVDECSTCNRQFVRQDAATTVGLKTQGVTCPGRKSGGRRCRGKLHDTILDWEDSLPADDLNLAYLHSCCADLSLCLGTTLQIVPSGNLPLDTKKRGGKLVICNLQPTKQDRHADLLIHWYVDDVLTRVMSLLKLPLPQYQRKLDPVFITRGRLSALGYPQDASTKTQVPEFPSNFEPLEWTLKREWVKDKKLAFKAKQKTLVKTKRKSRTNSDRKSLKKAKTKESVTLLYESSNEEPPSQEQNHVCLGSITVLQEVPLEESSHEKYKEESIQDKETLVDDTFLSVVPVEEIAQSIKQTCITPDKRTFGNETQHNVIPITVTVDKVDTPRNSIPSDVNGDIKQESFNGVDIQNHAKFEKEEKPPASSKILKADDEKFKIKQEIDENQGSIKTEEAESSKYVELKIKKEELSDEHKLPSSGTKQECEGKMTSTSSEL